MPPAVKLERPALLGKYNKALRSSVQFQKPKRADGSADIVTVAQNSQMKHKIGNAPGEYVTVD